MCCDQVAFFFFFLKCPPELNCTENYGIIAFSGVIYEHSGAGLLRLVGCGISAGLAPKHCRMLLHQ